VPRLFTAFLLNFYELLIQIPVTARATPIVTVDLFPGHTINCCSTIRLPTEMISTEYSSQLAVAQPEKYGWYGGEFVQMDCCTVGVRTVIGNFSGCMEIFNN
jgi:hypothetical protein